MLTIANSDEPIPYLIYSDGDSLEMLDAKLGGSFKDCLEEIRSHFKEDNLHQLPIRFNLRR